MAATIVLVSDIGMVVTSYAIVQQKMKADVCVRLLMNPQHAKSARGHCAKRYEVSAAEAAAGLP